MGKSTRRITKEKQGEFRLLVYICAPLRGEIKENTKQAILYVKFAYDKCDIPLTPHILFPFLDDSCEMDRNAAFFMDRVLLGKCQEVWVFGNQITEGMKMEFEISKRRNQPIRYFTKDCKEIEYAANDL